MAADMFHVYDDLGHRVWEQMVDLVGFHVSTVLVERALWLTHQHCSESEYIALQEGGISFGPPGDHSDWREFRTAVDEFLSSLINILTRLVDVEAAERLNEDVDRLLQRGEGFL
ncbi:MAG: hypothetical protein R6U70_03705 [Bacillota bacterium]